MNLCRVLFALVLISIWRCRLARLRQSAVRFIVAMMTEALDPKPTDVVLEIGTGSGYQAAVLSSLVSKVYTIEIVPELGQAAAEVLGRLQYDNVFYSRWRWFHRMA